MTAPTMPMTTTLRRSYHHPSLSSIITKLSPRLSVSYSPPSYITTFLAYDEAKPIPPSLSTVIYSTTNPKPSAEEDEYDIVEAIQEQAETGSPPSIAHSFEAIRESIDRQATHNLNKAKKMPKKEQQQRHPPPPTKWRLQIPIPQIRVTCPHGTVWPNWEQCGSDCMCPFELDDERPLPPNILLDDDDDDDDDDEHGRRPRYLKPWSRARAAHAWKIANRIDKCEKLVMMKKEAEELAKRLERPEPMMAKPALEVPETPIAMSIPDLETDLASSDEDAEDDDVDESLTNYPVNFVVDLVEALVADGGDLNDSLVWD